MPKKLKELLRKTASQITDTKGNLVKAISLSIPGILVGSKEDLEKKVFRKPPNSPQANAFIRGKPCPIDAEKYALSIQYYRFVGYYASTKKSYK